MVLDVRRSPGGRIAVWANSGTRSLELDPLDLAHRAEKVGAGEIVLNPIDRDGTMGGHDIQMIGVVRDEVHIPLTALGGAGSVDDIGELITEHDRRRGAKPLRIQVEVPRRADQLPGPPGEGPIG